MFLILNKRLLSILTAVLFICCVGAQCVHAADDNLRNEKRGQDEAIKIRWRTEQPDFRPNLAPAIWHTLVLQAIGFGLLQSLDSDVTNHEQTSFRNFREAFERGPAWEDDHWQWNYIAHPLWGSETYLRARAQGFGRFPSFLFSTASSFVWEFLFESWSSRPSTDDLLITSTTGSLLGELRFHLKRKLALNDSPMARVLDFVVDPLHGISRKVGSWFGKDWREPAFIRADSPHPPSSLLVLDPALIDGKVGVTMRVSWRF